MRWEDEVAELTERMSWLDEVVERRGRMKGPD